MNQNNIHTCPHCEEEWADDFWCKEYKYKWVCRNCCDCAYGLCKPQKDNPCIPIEEKHDEK